MTKFSIFTTLAIIANSIGLAGCGTQRKTTQKPAGEVQKVAYADKILLHMHPEKVLNYLPNLSDEQIAYMYGMTTQDYQNVKKAYEDEAKQAATELLKDAPFAAQIDKLPFKKGETILVLGESTADALNSWVYILKYLLEQRRPQDEIKVINAAISGQTTTEALRRITMQIKQNPNWVICHLGANDCMRYGDENYKMIVSTPETLENLKTIQKIISDESKAKMVWLAPNPINGLKASIFPPFKSMKLSIKNDDLMAFADILSKNFPDVVDFREGFDVPAKMRYVQFDGVHLSMDGQKIITQTLVNHLTTQK